MKFTVKDRPCLPVGAYVGRFVGCMPQDTSAPGWKPALGRGGNPLPPGLIWAWEITEGPRAGEVADRMTGRDPTPKSSCGQMLAMLLGRPLVLGEDVDVDALIGTIWRFHVVNKEMGQGTCVATLGLVRVRDLESGHRANGRARTAAELPGPPPDDDDGQELPEDDDKPRWWIKRFKGADAEAVDFVGLMEFVKGGADPAKDRCCPVGETKWRKIIEAVPEAAQVRPIT